MGNVDDALPIARCAMDRVAPSLAGGLRVRQRSDHCRHRFASLGLARELLEQGLGRIAAGKGEQEETTQGDDVPHDIDRVSSTPTLGSIEGSDGRHSEKERLL